MASPIGILIESLTDGIKSSGQRYIKLVTGILIVGLCLSLFASIISVKANLAMFPLLIVAAIILGLLNAWLFSQKVITPLVSIIFIALLLSFFFPSTFETLGLKISDVDVSIAEPVRLHITYDDIEKQRIKFFYPDGRPKVWYYRAEDGRFELFDKKGHHPTYREKLRPVTPEVISQIEKQLKAETERQRAEAGRLRSEMERLNAEAESANAAKEKATKEAAEIKARAEENKEAAKAATFNTEKAKAPKNTEIEARTDTERFQNIPKSKQPEEQPVSREDIDKYLAEGKSLFEKGKYRECREIMNRVLQKNPNNSTAIWYISKASKKIEESTKLSDPSMDTTRRRW